MSFRNNYIAFHEQRSQDIEPFPSNQVNFNQIPAYDQNIQSKTRKQKFDVLKCPSSMKYPFS